MRRSSPQLLSLCALFLLLVLPAQAQMPGFPPRMPDSPPAGLPEQAPDQPLEASISRVEVKDNLLSVDLVNISLGTALNTIAQQSGFRIEGSSETFGKTLSTRFSNLALEEGLIRLLTLVQEKNYLIQHGQAGAVSRLKVFGSKISGTSGLQPPSPQFQRPPIPSPAFQQPRPVLPPPRPAPVMRQPRPSVPQPPPQRMPGPDDDDEDVDDDDISPPVGMNEEPVRMAPAMPPPRRPVFIPPRKP